MNNHRIACAGPLVYDRVPNRFDIPELNTQRGSVPSIRKPWIGRFYFGLDANIYPSGAKIRWSLSTWIPFFLRQNYRGICKEYNYRHETNSVFVSKPVLMG